MRDTTAQPDVLDPQRPWITDENQLPSRMSWIGAMFNPTGVSSQLHFTRVWTVCFFLQLLIVIVPVFGGVIIGLAGGDPAGLRTLGLYASPAVFMVTTLISVTAHSRRLNDAGKTVFWALLVLLPLLIGLALFSMNVMSKSVAYDELYAKRAEFLADPQTWRAERLVVQQEKQQEDAKFRALNGEIKPLFTDIYLGKDAPSQEGPAVWRGDVMADFTRLQMQARTVLEETGMADPEGDESQEARGEHGSSGGGQHGGDSEVRADQELPTQVDFILKPNVGTIQMVLIGMNIFIMIWSLLWLARLPSVGDTRRRDDFVPESVGRAKGAFD